MTSQTYINGNFVDENNAAISVKERGFKFGDGVFETIRVANQLPYQWDFHIARLNNGLQLLKIKYDTKNLRKICYELLAKNQIEEGFLRISISRGIGSKGYLPKIEGEATIVIETVKGVENNSEAVDLFVSNYNKIPASCLPASAKTMQGLNSTLARIEAVENDCFEALLLDGEDNICEGSSSNIFWRVADILYTPSLDLGVLPGSMRDAVIRLAPYEVRQGKFSLNDLAKADEVFLTNSNWLAISVKSLMPEKIIWNENSAQKQIRKLILNDIKNNAA